MNKFLLSATLLLAIQADNCNKPTLCDEYCLRDKRTAASPIPDGSLVIAEGSNNTGVLRLPSDKPPVIVYADGSMQSAADARMVAVPAVKRPVAER